jgi:hypothetical protein
LLQLAQMNSGLISFELDMFENESTQNLAFGIILAFIACISLYECIKGILTGKIQAVGFALIISSILQHWIGCSAKEFEEKTDPNSFNGAFLMNFFSALILGLFAYFFIAK